MAWELDEVVKEVVTGDPELKAFHDADPGFRRFVDRHEVVARDPDAREEHVMWRHEEWLRALELRDIKAEGEAKAEAEIAIVQENRS